MRGWNRNESQVTKREKEQNGNRWKDRAGMLLRRGMRTEPGIDGILVTVGLCVIALLLCVVMKDSLQEFIETIVSSMTTEAGELLGGVTP